MSTYTVKKSTAIISVVLLIAAAGAVGFFAAGFAKASKAATQTFQGPNGMQRSGNAQRSAGGIISGELIKKDDGSMSLKTKDGSSKLVLVTSSTKAFKTSEASLNDFTTGQNLMVIGKQNSDGSVTAQTIQVRPEGMADLPMGGGFQQRTNTTGSNTNQQQQGNQFFGGPGGPPPGM